jgi:hypothetical protein
MESEGGILPATPRNDSLRSLPNFYHAAPRAWKTNSPDSPGATSAWPHNEVVVAGLPGPALGTTPSLPVRAVPSSTARSFGKFGSRRPDGESGPSAQTGHALADWGVFHDRSIQSPPGPESDGKPSVSLESRSLLDGRGQTSASPQLVEGKRAGIVAATAAVLGGAFLAALLVEIGAGSSVVSPASWAWALGGAFVGSILVTLLLLSVIPSRIEIDPMGIRAIYGITASGSGPSKMREFTWSEVRPFRFPIPSLYILRPTQGGAGVVVTQSEMEALLAHPSCHWKGDRRRVRRWAG